MRRLTAPPLRMVDGLYPGAAEVLRLSASRPDTPASQAAPTYLRRQVATPPQRVSVTGKFSV